MQDLKKYFKNHKHEWNFDSEEFREQMEKLKEELENMKDHKIHIDIDKEALKESMRELRKNLQELKNNPPKIDIDLDELHKNLQKMKKELKHQKWVMKDFNVHVPNIDINIPEMPDINIPEINVDIPDIDVNIPEIDLSGLEESMKDLNINMDNLNKEMEKLNGFIKDLKSEMVKDGLLESADEDAHIDIGKNEMRVNGVKVPDNLFEKYKKMYKEHLGKDLEDDNHFNIN
jgi:chromosome segregation ATPase